ncbi:MAG: mechanosensitive ion channel family protein [bacterium]|nr:mechanosensitive ion channel family protein [bacterium]
MTEWLSRPDGHQFLVEALDVGIVLAIATLVYFLVRWSLVRGVRRLVRNTATEWDDELVRAGVFGRISHIAPAFVVYYGMGFFSGLPAQLTDGIRRISIAVMLLVGALAIASVLRAAEAIYDSHPEYRQRPIKGYVQVVSILVYMLSGLLILAALMNRSPWIFVSGIGAMTAVLLLVFRDTILSLVASIQIASNDMIRVGDWIEMPELGADGDVKEVALHTVKVQNWDKTITTIPTHRLISDSFKNWRGMSESGGRRIKRSVSVDLQSVRFLSEEEIARFGRWSLLSGYIAGKRSELAEANAFSGLDPALPADLRRLTNLGTLRAWIWATLRSHPQIHQTGHTLLVRQLAAGPQGVPIEIYCFSKDTAWVRYEDIQGDLFDRILAMIPEFGLRVFQEPTGSDLARMKEVGSGPSRGISSAGEV